MSEISELEIPDIVKDYLVPILGNSPVGTDAANDEEYFKLSMEFPKTVPDYKNWIELSDKILKEKSKDIKVASWLCFALYRSEQLKGFKNGLEILYHLIKKFGNDLFPLSPVHKSKAIQFLNTSRVTKLIEREDINKSNSETLKKIGELLTLISSECEKLLPQNIPTLKGLQDIIASHIESADKTLNPPTVLENKSVPQPQPKREFKEPSSPVSREETNAPVKASQPASEDEASAQLRHTLTYFYEEIQNNETTERIPDSFNTFGIARQLQWSSLVLPSAVENVTSIAPPNDVIRKLLNDWVSQSKWDVLIPRIELEFIKDNSEFRYWLDGQRFLVTALEKKDGNYSIAAEDIKYHLSRLIRRLPELQTLNFIGGEIPFADKETLSWLNEIGKSSVSGSKAPESSSVSLSPIVDSTYEVITKEYEEAIAGLPKKFEESFNQMQQKLKAEDRTKGKFLRRLNIANLCYEAKQYNVAKVNLEELRILVEELKLAEWEPALSTSVWQSLYLTNVQLLFTTESDNKKNQLDIEQEDLIYKIAKHNGILAINLEQQKHKRK
ncbi:MAG: type VI secretion system domain-containing protein [Ignavibacteriota bacterium]